MVLLDGGLRTPGLSPPTIAGPKRVAPECRRRAGMPVPTSLRGGALRRSVAAARMRRRSRGAEAGVSGRTVSNAGVCAGLHRNQVREVVQRMLGHRSATLTLDLYGHLFDDDLGPVADSMHRGALAAADSLRTEQGSDADTTEETAPYLRHSSAPSGTRTHTWRILSPLPLPIGLWGRADHTLPTRTPVPEYP